MDVKDFCTGIQHIGVPTNNIEETIGFYKQLGFQVALQTKNGDEKVAFLQLHNLVIETYENHSAVMQAGAIDHIAIDVKEIDSLFEVVKVQNFCLLDKLLLPVSIMMTCFTTIWEWETPSFPILREMKITPRDVSAITICPPCE